MGDRSLARVHCRGASGTMNPHPQCLLLASLLLMALPGPGSAEPLEARYVAAVAGITVTEVVVLLDLQRSSYRIRTVLQTRGVTSLFGRGEQTTEAEGTFRNAEPVPSRFVTVGVWRGRLRHIEIDYPPGASRPVLRVLEPPETPEEREPVPLELSRGTLDPLSALVKLSRAVAETGRCDGTAAIFDGRRRTDAVARTIGRDLLPRRHWGGEAWSGEALHCGLEWHQLAGFQPSQDREERGRVNTGSAWIASAWVGGPPVPVRAELPIRWLGTLHLYLVHAAPVRERALNNQRALQPRH
jgi:hypothetical protein